MNLGDITVFGLPIGGYEPAGVHYRNHGSIQGAATSRRNPKRKKRLPYHAKKNVGTLPVMGRKGDEVVCAHSLAQHEEVVDNYSQQAMSGIVNTKTVSYALPCVSKHSSKKVQHRDITGRKW